MTINSTAAILLACYALVARRQGADRRKLSGTIQNDILKEYIARGTYIYPPRPAMRIITDIFAWAGREMPEWNTISISGYHIREAGSTAVQELAFTFANAIAYIEAAIQAGLAVDSFAPRLSFFFNSHSDFLEEIAKFRAARRIYAVLMRDRFGAADPRSMMLRFHVQTAGSTLTAQQPDVNMVRTAIAGAGGGAGRRPVAAHQLARRGPGAAHRGIRRASPCAPSRSSPMRRASPTPSTRWAAARSSRPSPIRSSGACCDYLKRIDEMGGTLRAIETGYIQSEIQNAAYEYQRAVESGERIVVGVNRFQQEEDGGIPAFRLDPALERAQIDRVRQVRAGRSARGRGKRAWRARRGCARHGQPDAADTATRPRRYATVGEISDRLRGVFGEYREG